MSANTPDEHNALEDLDWTVRAAVYAFIVEHERPPASAEIAATLSETGERVALAYRRLNQRHALFLEPGTLTIRMAHPFSGIATPFRARANGHTYWANCAWDMLGIPAALHADAEVAASYADTHTTPVLLTITQNRVYGHGEVIHFPLPFQRWYDDLVVT